MTDDLVIRGRHRQENAMRPNGKGMPRTVAITRSSEGSNPIHTSIVDF